MKPVYLKLSWGPDGVTAEGDHTYYHGNAIEQADGTRNGVYSEWSWDGDTLKVGTCRYGMSPLFYYCGDTEIFVSNSIPKLLELGAPNAWDDDAMAVFIRRQTFLGEDTPFKHIRATPPGARLTWKDGHMTLEGKAFAPKPQHLKRSAMIDGVIDLFAQAIARRLPQTDEFYLPLTGGKDSRHILLELNRQSALPKACVTASFPPPLTNQDREIAAQLAARVGVPHITLPPPPPGIADEQRKNIVTSFCTLDHGWTLPLTDFLADNAPVSYDGLGLDVFFNTIWYSDHRARLYDEGAFEALAIDLLRNSEEAFSKIFTRESFGRFSRERAIARLVDELKLHPDRPHPVAAFQFWSRTRRTTSTFTFGMQNAIPQVHTPFLDHSLFDFVSSLPKSALRESPMHIDVISTAYKDFDDIDYSVGGADQRVNKRYPRSFSQGLLRNSLRNFFQPSVLNRINTVPSLLKSYLSGNKIDLEWLNPHLLLCVYQIESFGSPQTTN
ncbi:asparagine synthase family protein [Denitrobaculum tricleocarpae]|uniref:asparagine synthase (glutamine-hydrolyzing) n=1 Tax=Denitrobaculum tricleocarpae TaxID=2591009 RepID=A0A545TUA3_9PROT|nr:asparagine synthetase B family protein [Denitrobaculum tricleocarpae]TQV80798.1 asparagine synthase [Denitrobaculum tricleocarpae]